MAHQSSDVYRYLIWLETYLLGDLQLFRKLATNAERVERAFWTKLKWRILNWANRIPIIKKIPWVTRNFEEPIPITKYPYSYQFNFGTPVISRGTIPFTTSLFSTIDTLGFLTGSNTDPSGSTKNFTTFFSHPSVRISRLELDVLINVYRHCLVHAYFPKMNMEISYHSSNPPGKLFFKNSRGDLVLNVNRLESVVICRLHAIINDSTLYGNMSSQFTILEQYRIAKINPHVTALLTTL